jgi:hypothetical protein
VPRISNISAYTSLLLAINILKGFNFNIKVVVLKRYIKINFSYLFIIEIFFDFNRVFFISFYNFKGN